MTSGIQDQRIYTLKTLYPFVKIWYKVSRYTTKWVRLDFDSAPEFGRTAYARLQRKGHLITRLFLVSNMPDIITIQEEAQAIANRTYFPLGVTVYPKFGWTNSLGHALVERLTLDIGGTRVEQIDSRLLEVLDEYNTPLEKVTVVNRLLPRNDSTFANPKFFPYTGESTFMSKNTRSVVPLPFWFTRGDSACALPIDAILADEVRVGVTFRNIQGLYYTSSRNLDNTSLDQGTGLWPLLSTPFYAKLTTPSSITLPGLDITDPSAKFVQVEGIKMPSQLFIGETYLLAEYIYLDQPEANRLRLADIQVPIVQHYALNPLDTEGLPRVILPLDVPNPTRDLFWMVQRVEAPTYNNFFIASRDLRTPGPQYVNGYLPLWWPNAIGLNAQSPDSLLPGFATRDSEPIKALAIIYEGTLVRARTENPALFRSILPSYQQKKTPWLWRYYYNFSFGIKNGTTAFSKPNGSANLDKIKKREMYIEFNPNSGCTNPNDVPKYVVYCWAETYNIFRVFGGRAGCMFAY